MSREFEIDGATIPPASVPSGIVTFLFTDVEGSTRLWAADAEGTARSLALHDEIIKGAIQDRGGFVFGWAGDHFRGAFEDPRTAVAASMAAQAALAAADWGSGPALRVRMGLHRGRATQSHADYFGPVPNLAARLEALARGGQVLMSSAVHDVVDIESRFLGTHRLRDVPEPTDVFQVGIDTFPALRSVDPSLSTLPNPGMPIVGRHEEVAQVRQLLESESMVTVTGIGGCGKTRLAVEVAYQELPSRTDGCYFADLSSVSDGAELAAAVAAAVKFELGGAGQPIDQLVVHLAHRDALLVLDNCEHIVDECAAFAESLLATSSSTAILATTRQRLGVAGEIVVAVPSLDHSSPESAAVELFVERARAVNPTFDPDRRTVFTVVEICDRLDGMPLAIELAAARTAVLAPSEILDRMADRFRLLSGGRGRHRRRTLQATLDWSYDLLDPDEQTLFRRLGLFVGSFDLPAVVQVGGFDDYDAMDLLESLVSKNLVTLDQLPGAPTVRYRLLETVRIYAGDQLARAEDTEAAQAAYIQYFRRLAATESFAIASSLERAIEMRWQWPNIASTLDHLGEIEDWSAAAEIAFGVHGLWDSQVSAVEGRRWLEPIVENLDPDDPLYDWVRYVLALVLMQLDQFGRVHELLADLSQAARPEPRSQAAGLYAFLSCRRFPERAVELADLAAEVVAEHGLAREFAVAGEWARGTIALYAGRHSEALASFEHSYRLAADVDDMNIHVVSGLAVASCQIMLGDPETALVTLDDRDWSRSVWDSSPIIRALAKIELGQVGDAADLIITFGYDALRGRLTRMANDAMVGLAALAVQRGEPERAWKLLQEGAVPRTPFTIGLAEFLADRLGYGVTLRQMHRERETPLLQLDATEALRAELDRMRAKR